MIETSARLLKLLTLLQSPRDWTGAELAEKLQVSPRTVRSDVERLRSLGYPVHATPGVAGGYRLGAGAALPPLLLDDEEAVAVTLSLRTAAGGAVSGIEEASLRALTKLQQVLPKPLARRVDALATYTVRSAGRRGPTVDGAALSLMAGACRDHERLRFGYLDHAGATSRREVQPHRLVNRGLRWYLVAWDVERADWRTFRVDRIEQPQPTGRRDAPREVPGGDAAAFVARGTRDVMWRFRAVVVVHAPAEQVLERVGDPVAVEVLDEDRCLLHAGADSAERVASWLSFLGHDFEVPDSPELRDALLTLADRFRRAVS